jgi:hypothetical protein
MTASDARAYDPDVSNGWKRKLYHERNSCQTRRMSSTIQRLRILTGGGDAPGLNAVICDVVKSASNSGIQ